MASTRTRVSDEEREQRRAQQRELVTVSIEQLRLTEGWAGFLRARRAFHSYSYRNVLLIAMQHPTATRVAGFHAWLKLGYCVREGEIGIRIWAPCPPSKKRLAAWRAAGADPDERPRTHWRLALVFDTLSRVCCRWHPDLGLVMTRQPSIGMAVGGRRGDRVAAERRR